MSRAKTSGYKLTKSDASIVLGMVARGDRDHDIAAWFGVNQGRIAEVKDGSHGTVSAAPANALPPKGPPGIKGRRLRAAIQKLLDSFQAGGGDMASTMAALKDAAAKYDSFEA